MMLSGRYHYLSLEETEAQRGLSNLSQISQLDKWKMQLCSRVFYKEGHLQTLFASESALLGVVRTRDTNKGQSFVPFKF